MVHWPDGRPRARTHVTLFTALPTAARICRQHQVLIRIPSKRHCLRRAIDQDGHVLDIPVQSRRNSKGAMRFFRKLLRGL